MGLYKLDLTQSDLTNEQQIMQMNEASLQWVSHYKCDVIDLALHENATMRIAFGHLKYYVANSKLLDMAAANDVCFVHLCFGLFFSFRLFFFRFVCCIICI